MFLSSCVLVFSMVYICQQGAQREHLQVRGVEIRGIGIGTRYRYKVYKVRGIGAR